MEIKKSIIRRLLPFLLVFAVLSAVFLFVTTHFDIKGHYEGIFLLKARHGALFEIKDDLYLGDGSRLIFGLDTDQAPFRYFRVKKKPEPGKPFLEFKWDKDDGSGYVMNFLPDGGRILTCFSRFCDSEGLYNHGLFVGGGLPAGVRYDRTNLINETGMSYSDGTRWYHLWCNANEGLASVKDLRHADPAHWLFLGSKILNYSDKALAIKSSHEALVDGVPLRIDRYAYFKAGDKFFILSIIIKNTGNAPVSFYYAYGDEPWLGDYGSSKGNVGWVDGHIVSTVQYVDTSRFGHAGFFDYGNTAVGEGHNYTRKANFIKWVGGKTPLVYFSNRETEFPDKGNEGEPLGSDTRFIGLQWGPQALLPGEKVRYALVIGMADQDKNGFPVIPDIKLSYIPN